MTEKSHFGHNVQKYRQVNISNGEFYYYSWASEGFFPGGGAIGDFFKTFPGDQN